MTPATTIALETLLQTPRASDLPVATRAGTTLNFAQFLDGVSAWQAGYRAAGVQRCALHFHDSFDFACALFGAWAAGVCVWLPADVLPATRTRLDSLVDGYAGDIDGVEALRHVQAKRNADPAPLPQLDRDAEMLVVFTSGSTAAPVAIPKRLAQLFDEVTALAACWDGDIGPAQVLATVSHQHIYGLLFRILWPLASARPFAATRLAFPEDIARETALQPCILVASPAHLKRLPSQLPWSASRHMLRGLFSSGGPLPDEALPDCRSLLGRAPVEVYGSSETGGIAWRRRERDDQVAWQALPGVSIVVEDDVLRVCSPHVDSAAGVLTADRVAVTSAGFVLLGRRDRVVKIEEKRVSLTALEAALIDGGLVSEARALLLPEARAQLGVVVVPSVAGWALVDAQGRRDYSEALRQQLADVVEPSARPRRWRLHWSLPSNAQGKTTEADLLTLFDPRRPNARLLERSDSQALLAFDMSADSPYLDGHFVETPVLPGVTQVEWAMRFAAELFPLSADFQRLDALKFQQVVRPGDALRLELSWIKERSSVGFAYRSPSGQHSSGRIVLGGLP